MNWQIFNRGFLALLITFIALLVLDAPIRGAVGYENILNTRIQIASPLAPITANLSDVFSDLSHLIDIENKNKLLSRENNDLKLRIIELEKKQAEYELLISSSDYINPKFTQLIVADLLQYEYFPRAGYAYIHLGKEPVATKFIFFSGLIVGEIVSQSGDIAKVKLVVSEDSKIPVVVGGKHNAILSGQLGSGLKLEGIPVGSPLQKGEKIKLLNPEIPELNSFYLGQVNEVKRDPLLPDLQVSVDFPVDLFTLTQVTLIKK